MSERERLIELIDDCRAMEGYGYDLVEKQADYLLANGVTVQRWMPVTERLPEERKKVLIHTEDENVGVAHLCYTQNREGWVFVWEWEDEDLDGTVWCVVTHWMPLPEPPEEEEEHGKT